MISMIKSVNCYCPKYIGENDILICGDKIYKIRPEIQNCEQIENIYDCKGMLAFPGIIDQHEHIIGGGGEAGFNSHIPELDVNKIMGAGITTIVGLLGADDVSRSLFTLFSKAKALEAQGLTTYIYSGSYRIPFPTFSGNIVNDLILVDKVIGAGEIAMSDHRSSYSNIRELIKTASDIHLGGLLSGKAGVMHIHMGDGKGGLMPLIEILEKTDLPKEEFVPTHMNRNTELFTQALNYCRNGGNIDFTSGEKAGIPVPEAVKMLIEKGVKLSRVTISSDANGSSPDGGINEIMTLYQDVINCIVEKNIGADVAFSLVTENVAKLLKIYPQKGALKENSDADILIIDKNYSIKKLFAKGKLVLDLKD